MQIKKAEKVGKVNPKNPWVDIKLTVEKDGREREFTFSNGLEDRSFEINPWPSCLAGPNEDENEVVEKFTMLVWEDERVNSLIEEEIEKL